MATVIRLRSRLERPERSQMSPKSHLSVASRSLGKSAAQFGAGRGAGWSGIVVSSSCWWWSSQRTRAPALPGPSVDSRKRVPSLRGVQELDRLFVDFHVLAVGDRRGLGRADEMAPAPRQAGRVELLERRLVVLEGVH